MNDYLVGHINNITYSFSEDFKPTGDVPTVFKKVSAEEFGGIVDPKKINTNQSESLKSEDAPILSVPLRWEIAIHFLE